MAGGAGGRVLGVHVISMGFACDIDVCTISTVGSGIARQCEADGVARPTAVVWVCESRCRSCSADGSFANDALEEEALREATRRDPLLL